MAAKKKILLDFGGRPSIDSDCGTLTTSQLHDDEQEFGKSGMAKKILAHMVLVLEPRDHHQKKKLRFSFRFRHRFFDLETQ